MPLSSWEILGMFSKWENPTHCTCVSHCHHSETKHVFYWGSDTILTAAHKVARCCRSCPRGGGISPFPSISTTHGEDWVICYYLVKLHRINSFVLFIFCSPLLSIYKRFHDIKWLHFWNILICCAHRSVSLATKNKKTKQFCRPWPQIMADYCITANMLVCSYNFPLFKPHLHI